MSHPYLSLEAELHDAFWQAEDDESEVPLIADFLERHPGPALEMGSGAGRLLLPLIQMGYPAEGLELSPDMLTLARNHAHRAGLQPTLHEGDMSSWRGTSAYSAILAPAFTLQLSADPAATLRHWHSLLAPSGGLYLTVFIPYAELHGDHPENEWYPDHHASLPDGRTATLETRHSLNLPDQAVHREHRYEISGNPPIQHTSTQTIRWFDHSQMLTLLKDTGFEVVSHCLDFDPARTAEIPDPDECDGILTYFAMRSDV